MLGLGAWRFRHIEIGTWRLGMSGLATWRFRYVGVRYVEG
jgi:hypothetical protein